MRGASGLLCYLTFNSIGTFRCADRYVLAGAHFRGRQLAPGVLQGGTWHHSGSRRPARLAAGQAPCAPSCCSSTGCTHCFLLWKVCLCGIDFEYVPCKPSSAAVVACLQHACLQAYELVVCTAGVGDSINLIKWRPDEFEAFWQCVRDSQRPAVSSLHHIQC